MSWIDDVIADYGRSLGLPTLELNGTGVASLRFGSLGELFIEQLDEGVVMYLSQAHERPEPQTFVNAMTACHWDRNPPFSTNASLNGDQNLVFSVTLRESDVDVPTLERTVDYLGKLHNEAREGSHA